MSTCANANSEFTTWRKTGDEELVNTVTHGFGLLAAVYGALVMVSGVSTASDPRIAIGCGVYLATLVSVYLTSTLSHGFTLGRWKTLFRKLDQAFIYLLIVGTYTPLSLAYLQGGFWNLLLGGMWVVALTGFVAKAVFGHRIDSGSIKTYLLLGWAPIIAFPTLWYLLPSGAFALIIGGGVCYLIGTIFLTNDERVRHFHAAWHLMVIAGTTCHYLALLAVVHGGR